LAASVAAASANVVANQRQPASAFSYQLALHVAASYLHHPAYLGAGVSAFSWRSFGIAGAIRNIGGIISYQPAA